MAKIRLEKLIAGLKSEKPVLDPRIKGEVMAYAKANGFSRSRNPFWRYAVGFACLIIFGAGGTVFASQRAQPGEALYQVKRASESAYVTMQPNLAARAQATEVLIARRIAEARLTQVDHADYSVKSIEAELAMDERLADDLARESDDWVKAQEGAFSLSIEKRR